MHQLLRHVAQDLCADPDCEVHRIEVGLEEQTVSEPFLAFFIAGMQVGTHMSASEVEDETTRLIDLTRV